MVKFKFQKIQILFINIKDSYLLKHFCLIVDDFLYPQDYTANFWSYDICYDLCKGASLYKLLAGVLYENL